MRALSHAKSHRPVALVGQGKMPAPPQQQQQQRQRRRRQNEPATEGGEGQGKLLHVVYLLSRDGKVEQPHLIRVRHCSRHVRLRDVKRWVSGMRGEGVVDAFAWSCKRRYKAGFVWEDLNDDDGLVPPVSDDEYVLKGSLITHTAGAGAGAGATGASPATVPTRPSYYYPSAVTADPVPQRDPAGDPKSRGHPQTPAAQPANPDRGDDEEDEEDDEGRRSSFQPPPPPPPLLRPVEPTRPAICPAAAVSETDPPQAAGPPPQPASDDGSGEITEDAASGCEGEEKKGPATIPAPRVVSPGKRRGGDHGGRGGRRPRGFRALLGCGAGAAQTNDSALRPVSPGRAGELRGSIGYREGGGVISEGSQRPRDPTEGGGARRSRGGGRSPTGGVGEAAAEGRRKAAPAGGHKPAAEPNCSQCGRAFRPERLHAHMKSCRALKGQRKGRSSGKLPQQVPSQRAMLSDEAGPLFLLSH